MPPSERERFWDHDSYAVVGHSARRRFPRLTFAGLRRQGKRVHAVDPSASAIDGTPTVADLSALPKAVDAAVLEVPPDETRDWVARVADAGIRRVWIHRGTDTPDAVGLARERGVEVLTGACAVMYLTRGLTVHSVHRWIERAVGRY